VSDDDDAADYSDSDYDIDDTLVRNESTRDISSLFCDHCTGSSYMLTIF